MSMMMQKGVDALLADLLKSKNIAQKQDSKKGYNVMI